MEQPPKFTMEGKLSVPSRKLLMKDELERVTITGEKRDFSGLLTRDAKSACLSGLRRLSLADGHSENQFLFEGRKFCS